MPLDLISEPRRRILGLLRVRDRTIPELALELGVTGNAIRGHLSALERSGLLGPGAWRREGVGKPARLYRLSAAGEELFPRGYARLLSELLELLTEWDGAEGAAEVMREVGTRLRGDGEGLEGAIRALRALGAEVERGPRGGELAVTGCPIAAVSLGQPRVCALMAALVGGAASVPVAELCDRGGGSPRCRFGPAAG